METMQPLSEEEIGLVMWVFIVHDTCSNGVEL